MGAFSALGILIIHFFLLGISFGTESFLLGILFFFFLIFTHTGLFITAHDGMHGTISQNKVFNNWISSICLFVYAGFSFKTLKRAHILHHKFPGGSEDPDSSPNEKANFTSWYLNFFFTYFSWKQILIIQGLVFFYYFVLDVSMTKILIFYAGTSILSSLQLFYFGTYLPHRRTGGGLDLTHQARSLKQNCLVSFLSCYHFGGYHLEHHLYPWRAWWELPKSDKLNLDGEKK